MDENTDMYYAKTFRDIKMFNAFKTRSVFGNQMCTMFIYFPGTAFVFVSVPCVGVFNIFAHKVFGRKYFCRKSSNMVHNIFSPCVNIFTHGLEYISHMAKPSSAIGFGSGLGFGLGLGQSGLGLGQMKFRTICPHHKRRSQQELIHSITHCGLHH